MNLSLTVFVSVIIFAFGAVIGSFLSVVIYRLNKGKSGIIAGRSICPNCKKKIKWQHLIPIFSWIFLRGKCAYCDKRISFHYLALEFLTALLFLVAFLKWNFIEASAQISDPTLISYSINLENLQTFIFYIVEFVLLITIFFYDFLHKEIPDRLSIPAIVIAIAGNLLVGSPLAPAPMDMLLGGSAIAIFFLLQFVLSRGTWIGGGDIRLGALMGVLLGWEKGLLALVIAYLTGAIISLILMIGKKVHRKSMIPFGPFLVGGILIALFFGNEILDWYFATLF